MGADSNGAQAPRPVAAACVAELRHVCKTYHGGVPTPVLFDIDLQLAAGEFVAVVGRSGSGKTTMLNVLGLLDVPTAGVVRLGGIESHQLSEAERARMRRDHIGFVFQFHYLLPEFTALENALLACRLHGRAVEAARRQRLIDLFTEVGLGARLHHRPYQLSGGEQQRVAVVRALANDARLVLADEPTGNLDSASGREVFGLMRRLNRATGNTVLMVTHNEQFACEADRVLHLVDGRLEPA